MTEFADMKAKQDKIMLFGNPGVGKSTIINSVVGKIVSHSGFSRTGSGITTKYSPYHSKLGILLDTPGLDDVKTRATACEEITKALKQNGTYKLIFLCTMESGRVRGNDVATVESVMNAVDCPYNVIVTKLGKVAYESFEQQGSTVLRSLLQISGKQPEHIFGIRRLEQLDDLEDKVYEGKELEDILNFIRSCEGKVINSINVDDVKAFSDKRSKELEEQIKKQQEKLEFLEKSLKEKGLSISDIWKTIKEGLSIGLDTLISKLGLREVYEKLFSSK